MQGLRHRSVDIGKARGRELERRIGRELRLARTTRGYRQVDVSRRAAVSQSMVSEIELGEAHPSIDVLARVAAACDHELGFKLYPVAGTGFRDTPQLQVAQQITQQTHAVWHMSTEVPIGDPQGRAADLVLEHPEEVVHVEIETTLLDFQAQFRPAQSKRSALAARFDRPVRLVIAVLDTRSVRQRVAGHAEPMQRFLPVASRDIWNALRHGTPVGGDGILFVRPRALRLRAGSGKRETRRVTTRTGTTAPERPLRRPVTATSGARAPESTHR